MLRMATFEEEKPKNQSINLNENDLKLTTQDNYKQSLDQVVLDFIETRRLF